MSAIAGWLTPNVNIEDTGRVMAEMTAGMVSGPLDEKCQYWITSNVALGIGARRSTTDKVRRSFTTQTPEGAITLVFCGEIYNCRDLSTSLAAHGHKGSISNTASLLVAGYLEWEENLPCHLNGAFAIAIWDGRKEQLILIRDHLGVAPLYYQRDNQKLIFGSEIKSILAHPLASRAIDSAGLREVFMFSVTRGKSIWKNIFEVVPGTVLSIDSSGARKHTYWQLKPKLHQDSKLTTIERVREILLTATSRRLATGTTPASLLSGGLDSSAVSGLAALRLTNLGHRLRTFSVIPGTSRDTPEMRYAHDVAALTESKHQDLFISSRQLADPALRRSVIDARATPATWGDADISLYIAFLQISEDFNSILAGDGADALFGFHPERTGDSLSATDFVGEPILWIKGWRKTLRADVKDLLELDSFAKDRYADAVSNVQHLEDANEIDRHMRTICHLSLTQLCRPVFERTECLSSTTGIQVRLPYCDPELVEYVYNVPWHLKVFDGREKSLLRHATTSVLPPSVIHRSKVGYPMVGDDEYTTALKIQAREMLADRQSPVFEILDHQSLQRSTHVSETDLGVEKYSFERALDLYHWFDIYRPSLLLD